MDTYEKVRQYIFEQDLIRSHQRILVGVSGGADSLCLLCVLCRLKEELSLELVVVHVHHMLRGAAADRDSDFVRRLAEKKGLPFYLVKEDVKALAAREHLSEEEAGRNIRYKAFAEIAAQQQCHRIAVAHHQNDQAETVLFHLFRGSDIQGMTGMRSRNGQIIRPLLCLNRRQIEDYLEREGISWCQDATNEDVAYTRNRIRHDILPLAEQYINDQAVSHVARTAESLAQAKEYIDCMVCQVENQCIKDNQIYIHPLMEQHPYVQKQIVYRQLGRVAGKKKDLEAIHTKQIMELLHRENGKKVILPYGVTVVKEYDRLSFLKREDGQKVYQEKNIPEGLWIKNEKGEYEQQSLDIVNIELTPDMAEMEIFYQQPEGGIKVRFYWLKDRKDIDAILKSNAVHPKKCCTKYLDCGKMKNAFSLRFPLTGDFMEINREGQTKRFNRLCIDQKVPARLRNKLLVLANGAHILWICGMDRISEACRLDENSKLVLVCQYERIRSK